ncbi:MAG TPA: FAD-binding oxidoreductase [Pyrinomonadaceae bacterium]|nr:FAD-binding oxidoreductase [Pyrinomonadaceae bacterium]
MQVKTQADELQNYLTDASNMPGGYADKLFIPETSEEIAEILRDANEKRIEVTVSGARTGTVGGAIPFGGFVISLEKFNKIKEINKEELFAVVESGVILNDFQKAVEAEDLFYPPDPTEWSCQIGGTVATNASGARSFKYGATREFVEELEIVLANGEILNLKRGANVSENGFIELETVGGTRIRVKLPTYRQPDTRKNTSGYFSGENVDAIDLFIGSEGTLGIITKIKLKVLPKPESFFSGIIFFENEADLLSFVNEVREISFNTRKTGIQDPKSKIQSSIDASLLEYFDEKALKFISEKFPEVPANAKGAIFFEQETNAETEDSLLEQWNELLEKSNADLERSWFTTTEQDREKMRSFRHALPVSVNERIVRNKQKKVGTDMAVPDDKFVSFLRFYKEKLDASGLEYVIFGHIGDNHLHANMIPKNETEARAARHLYGRFIAQSIMLGGTISAEHGIGKHKSKYLYVQYGERFLNEMAELKKAFDPKGILGRGNMFDAKFLNH